MLSKILEQIISKGNEVTLSKLGNSIKLSVFSGEGMHEPIIQNTIDDAIKIFCEDNPKLVDYDDYLMFITKDQEAPTEVEEMSIDHPFLFDFKKSLNSSIIEAISCVEKNTIATVASKIEVHEAYNAPEFANQAKLMSPLIFSVDVCTKRNVAKKKGISKEFIARMVDGRMLLIDPDRQMSLAEIAVDQDESIIKEMEQIEIDIDDEDDEAVA